MINHARTLLMNTSGQSGYLPNYPGEELIPSSYRQIELPTYLDVIRMRLFGANPDRVMLNYRAAQLLQLIAATELQGHILELDSRLTYSTPHDMVDVSAFKTQVRRFFGDGNLSLIGRDTAPDSSGKSIYGYQVTVSGGDVITERKVFPLATTTEPIVLTSGLSQEFKLPYSDYRFRINTDLPAGWTIRGFVRPRSSLAEIDRGLRSVGEPYLLQLFGVSNLEPYATFYNCWKRHPDFAYRIGGLVLAMIYRTEELRNGST